MKKLIFLLALGCFIQLSGQERNAVKTDRAKTVNVQPSASYKKPYRLALFSAERKSGETAVVLAAKTVQGAVSTLSGISGGASAAAYARVKVTFVQAGGNGEVSAMTDGGGNFMLTLQNEGEYNVIVDGAEYGKVVLKAKHDTVKNSINNVR